MKHFWVYFTFCFVLFSCSETHKNIKVHGAVFGTSYAVIYEGDAIIDFQDQLEQLFDEINKSMSTYQSNSLISQINRNESDVVDEHFIKVFNASEKIHQLTNGHFDPTIGPLVNAWDFGPEQPISALNGKQIDSLMQFVGFESLKLTSNKITKTYPQTFVDFNAIAKGYGVDAVAQLLKENHKTNFLVEIGGEIRSSGINIEKDKSWKVGVEAPNFDDSQSILKAIELSNSAMATSGTYRKYKTDKDGNRYAHIINAKTGYPSKTSILSASVIMDNCMEADAYATAFKAMGVNGVSEFCKAHPEIKVFLIYETESKGIETLSLNNFPE
ncbi:MAG: thiamine biosynthesis protein [Bacteroidetes bacterium MedPE-SWsnd-G2]|nr:MAG: thiamine biosynthesis protein [Bacteroidetes bacterium MedPE-SWsnd-G2]